MNIRKIGKFLLFGLAGLVGLILLLLLGVSLALNRAPRYQAEIKEWVHTQTGYHIDFAHVSPAFRWYGPELYFDRLELRSKDDQRVLVRAAGGRVALDVWQLLRSGKLLAGRIELDAPTISIARLAPDRFAVASEIELGGEHASAPTLKVDDLPAGNLVIRHAVLMLQNWNAALPELALRDVSISLRRDDAGIAAAFTATLPQVLGGTVSVRGGVRGHGLVPASAWDALAVVHGISFPGWREFLPEYLTGLDAGTGSFELAAAGKGASLLHADLDFSATGVETRAAGEPIAKFDQMSGSLTLAHNGDNWRLTGKRVRAARGDPESAFDVAWRGGDGGLLDLSARASYLRAETLLPLTGFLPQKNVRDRLREIAPTGEWTDTTVGMARKTVGDPWTLQVQAKFHAAGFAAVGSAPGFRGLSGSMAGTQSGGHVSIDTNSAVFSWPNQIPQPVNLDLLKMNVYWNNTAERLLIASPGWEIKNHDGDIHGKLAWMRPADGSSPVMTLLATVENGNVADAHDYFPRGLLAPSGLAWMNRAFVAGHLSRADALIQGSMRQFPFRDGGGLFLVRVAIDGMTLDYADGWPLAEGISATAEFRNEGLAARLVSGRIGGIPVESAEARFADFKTGELRIRAGLRGDTAQALSFLRATPLDAAAEHVFSNAEATGPLTANLDIFLPFKDFINRRVLVHGHLDGAKMNLTGSTVMATDLNGDFDIDNGQVAHADIRGQLLGGAFQMLARESRGRAPARTQLEFRGSLNAEAARTALAVPQSIDISGRTDWRAVLKITPEPMRERSLRISSTLAGLEMKLPAPLDKPAGAPLPSWLEIQWPASGAPLGKLALGSVVSGSYALEKDADGLRLAHASLLFGDGEPTVGNSQIFDLGGSVEKVDLAGWLKLSTPDKNAKPLSYYVRDAKLDVAELDYLGLAFRQVSLGLVVTDSSLHIAVSGPNVSGTIVIPTAIASTEPWSMQFQRLHFEVADREEVPGVATPGVVTQDVASAEPPAAADAKGFSDPHGIPAINFHAAQLVWGERKFGDVQATLTKLDDGISLQQLIVTGPSFSASVKGEWRGKDAGTSRIEGNLTSTDVQNTLKELGYADVIQAKNGKMDFDLNWVGAPTAEALAQVAGHVQLSLDKGQITGLKPGAGRVLGLASIAALPRRLSLDFSDLTDKGLAFDTVHGDFDLREGNAYTENVLLKGPAAEIGLIGRVGLKNKDYDQTAVVTGSVGNSLSIPLASALVGGPIAGAAVLLFTQVFKQPLKGLARGYYRITGSWDNPTVERIKSAGAAAATAEAPK